MRSSTRTILLAALVLAAACSSTSLVSTWRAPDVGPLAFRRVLIYAPLQDPSLRRSTEDAVAQQVKGTVAVPSYTIIPDANVGDRTLLQQKVREGGFDGVAVFRIVAVTREANWVPGAYWGSYYAGPIYDPGYLQVDTIVRMETNVYDAGADKLVWASASATTNPSSMRGLAKSVATKVAKEMRKQGLLL